MRDIKLLIYLSLAAVSSACAQTKPEIPLDVTAGSDEGTITCKTEKSMVTLMQASLPFQLTNQHVLDRVIKSGDCLIMPKGWAVLVMDDPPLEQQRSRASKWTVHTPHGIIQMWGTPFGGD